MWSELFRRASDNLLSLHIASANVLGHYSRRFKRFSLTLRVIEFLSDIRLILLIHR